MLARRVYQDYADPMYCADVLRQIEEGIQKGGRPITWDQFLEFAALHFKNVPGFKTMIEARNTTWIWITFEALAHDKTLQLPADIRAGRISDTGIRAEAARIEMLQRLARLMRALHQAEYKAQFPK